MTRHWKKAVLALVVVIVGIQLVPVDRTNPPVRGDFDGPLEVKAILRAACYDCHSYETRWPWYSHVAPVSWLVAHDVEDARAEFSFSDWQLLDPRKRNEIREEIWKQVERDEMPLPIYRVMHAEARLTPEQRATLRDWTRRPDGPVAADDDF
jgi:hypothetical protein